VPRPAIDRALSRRDVPLREKTLWRMLYETAARASEMLALNIDDLDPDARRAPIRSTGGDTEWICWGSGTAHLLPRLIRGRQAGSAHLTAGGQLLTSVTNVEGLLLQVVDTADRMA
jgi:integrase